MANSRVKEVSPNNKYKSEDDNDELEVELQNNDYTGITTLIKHYNSQCSVNILESQKYNLNIKEEKNKTFLEDELKEIFKRSDFQTQMQIYGKALSIDGKIYVSFVKIAGLWYIAFNKKSEVEAKKIFRNYIEIYFKLHAYEDDVEGNDNEIYIKQELKQNYIKQTKVIKTKDGTFKPKSNKVEIIKNINFIPTSIIRNNCDSTSDIHNVEWLIKKLGTYWKKIDNEYNHTRSLILNDSSTSGGADGEQIAKKRGFGTSRVISTPPFTDVSSIYQLPPQQPFDTLISTVEWIEDKIFKFILSFREKNLKDKQQKNNLEIAALDQIAIEYYMHKKKQREDDWTYFFNEIVIPILNIESSNVLPHLNYFNFEVSEFQKAKLESIKASQIKNANLMAQSNSYVASASKMISEKARIEIESKVKEKELNVPINK